MTTAISPITFQASWNRQNKHLQDNIFNRCSRFCLSIIQKIAIQQIIPAATFPLNQLEQINAEFERRWAAGQPLRNSFTPTPIEVTTPDGAKLYGTYYKHHAAQNNSPTVIFFQPNAALAKEGIYEWLLEQGAQQRIPYNFVSFDYRGCGSRENKPRSMKDLYLDGDSIYNFVRQNLGVPTHEIRFYSWSLGGGISAQVRKMHPECSGPFVTERSFSSLINIIKNIARKIACGPLLTDVFARPILSILNLNCDGTNALKKVKGKRLIVHHPNDQIMKGQASLYQSIFKKGVANSRDIKSIDLSRSGQVSFNYHCEPVEHFVSASFNPVAEISQFLFQANFPPKP